MESRKIRQCAGAIHFGRPNDSQRRHQLHCRLHLLRVRGVLDQFHNDKSGDQRWLGKRGEPLNGRRMIALNVNQDIGVQEKHEGRVRLSLIPPLGGLTNTAGMLLTVGNIRSRADQALFPPIVHEFSPGFRRVFARSSRKQAQCVFFDGQTLTRRFSGKIVFHFFG